MTFRFFLVILSQISQTWKEGGQNAGLWQSAVSQEQLKVTDHTQVAGMVQVDSEQCKPKCKVKKPGLGFATLIQQMVDLFFQITFFLKDPSNYMIIMGLETTCQLHL